MTPRAVPPPIPASCHLPARSAAQSASAEPFTEPFVDPPIRRYAMHWLQHAAARINKRHVRPQRQRLLTEAVPGIDHLFDLSDIPTRPFRRVQKLHGSESGAPQNLNRA